MGIAIKVEGLSKRYRLGQISTGTLSRDLERWWAIKRGKEDPFGQVGGGEGSAGGYNEVWSLQDVSFDVEQGTSVGVIGRNGAGKSTLLKILSRVTAPTRGTVSLKGRVASLLEVGTGFHPELTGRENVFLNGGILGMRKHEVRSKFDEIVDFSGVGKFIDTPVKRYSSGMYVRLAFAVAAHLDSEILVVDEVLAVGDMAFQKKCLGKMGQVSRDFGRTVLFVSHNMASIKALCSHSVVLSNGKLLSSGNVEHGIESYLKSCREDADHSLDVLKTASLNGGLQSAFFTKSGSMSGEFLFGEAIDFEMRWDLRENLPARVISIRVFNIAGELMCGFNTLNEKFDGVLDSAGNYSVKIRIDNGLPPGLYHFDIGSFIRPHTTEFSYPKLVSFEVLDIPMDQDFIPNIVGSPRYYPRSEWTVKNEKTS